MLNVSQTAKPTVVQSSVRFRLRRLFTTCKPREKRIVWDLRNEG